MFLLPKRSSSSVSWGTNYIFAKYPTDNPRSFCHQYSSSMSGIPWGGSEEICELDGARFSAISRYEVKIESQIPSCMFPFPRTPPFGSPGNTQQIFSRPPPAAEFTIAWPLQQASNAALKEIWSGSWSERTKKPTTHRWKRFHELL